MYVFLLCFTINTTHFCSGEYVGLTGARLDGPDVLACGLATHFVPSKVRVCRKRYVCTCTCFIFVKNRLFFPFGCAIFRHNDYLSSGVAGAGRGIAQL